ncbi:MAG: hypothetical protein MUD01_02885 [Chloroflexaceae bacterium]|jgi:hypothetical protein|nr:hypothetical protein [Chloroflexaceae bacterium]
MSTTIEWRTPAPTWTIGSINGLAGRQPTLTAWEGDSFLPDFLALMDGQRPGETPADLARRALPPRATPTRLFQPAHGRYYLVTGSLVCRQISLPDRTVARASGEKASFVVRRLQTNAQGQQVEQAWVDSGPQRGWHSLANPRTLHAEEERLPLHHVAACAAHEGGSSTFADAFGLSCCGGRTVYYGYVPVGNREKYAQRTPPALNTDPTLAFQEFVNQVLTDEPGHDPRKDDVDDRIINPWRGLYVNPVTGTGDADTPPDDATRKTFSLYLLLDMLDVIQANLPGVYAALGGDGSTLAGNRKALFDALNNIKNARIGSADGLPKVLDGLKPHLQLVQNKPGVPPVSDSTFNTLVTQYDLNLTGQNAGSLASLASAFKDALDEEKNARPAGTPWVPTPSDERLGLLRDQVVPQAEQGEDVLVLRLAYEHPPCCPVLSDASIPVIFAKFYDPDAPARHIRIELPSIKPRDLRNYKKGVGLEMSPELRKLMGQVHKGLLDGDDLGAGGGFTLGMICSFSLQIIFLVAFIVMFIFLIALNFIFWWLPFLKICFPIPKKK